MAKKLTKCHQDAIDNLTLYLDARIKVTKMHESGKSLLLILATDNFNVLGNFNIATLNRMLDIMTDWGRMYYDTPSRSRLYSKWVTNLEVGATNRECD
jgi:hypothetical protein